MARFKPSIFYETTKSYNTVDKTFNTYRELKKALRECIIESKFGWVSVYRSRRGEWGEWFEHWAIGKGEKLVKIKEGWM